MTFKIDEKQQEKEPTKEIKDGMETLVQGLLEPKISLDETREYERYYPIRIGGLMIDILHILKH